MHESRDRRSAVRRLAAIVAAGSGAAFAARAGASAHADADAARKGKKQRRVELAYGGMMSGVTYTPHPDGDDAHWIIRGRQDGDAEVRHMRSGRQDAMSAAALHAMMMTMSGGGEMNGSPAMSVGGMNWRVETAGLDDATGEWTIDARVCDSNPDARPATTPAGSVAARSSLDPVSGCSCSGCSPRCYQCDDGTKRCGRSYCAACQGCW